MSDVARKAMWKRRRVSNSHKYEPNQYINVPSKESVERETGDQDAVCELNDAGEDEEHQETVDEFESGGSVVEICSPERLYGTCRRRRLRRRSDF